MLESSPSNLCCKFSSHVFSFKSFTWLLDVLEEKKIWSISLWKVVKIYFVGRSERCVPACLDLSIVHKSQTWHPGSKDSPIFYLHPTETVPRSSTSWTDGYFLALSSSAIFRGRTCSSCKSNDQLKTYFCCLCGSFGEMCLQPSCTLQKCYCRCTESCII